MKATLYIGYDNKPVAVLKGARDWIEQRAVAYARKGFDIVIEVLI